MIDIVFSSIYIGLLGGSITTFVKRKYELFLLLLLFLVCFSPMMQYVVFPQYRQYDAQGYMYMGSDRVWMEYLLTFFLTYWWLSFSSCHKYQTNKMFSLFALGYIIVNIPQFLTCVNYERSLNGFIISVINPILYCSLFNHIIASKERIRVSWIGRFFYAFFFVMFLSYIIVSIYNITRGVSVESDEEGTMNLLGLGFGLGIFRDRTLLTPFFVFITALFSPKEGGLNKHFFLLPIFYVLVLVIFLTSNSRTMYAVFLLSIFLIIVVNPFKNRYKMVRLFFVLFLLITIVSLFSTDNTIFDIIISRFHQKGDTIISSASEDERFEIWEQAVNCAESSNYLGVGLGNFHLYYIKHFSNAHSLYYSFLAERGVLSVFYIVILFAFMFIFSIKCFKKTKFAIYAVIALGVLSFSLVVYTGDEFLNISQAVFALNPYIIFTNLAVLSNYKRISNE